MRHARLARLLGTAILVLTPAGMSGCASGGYYATSGVVFVRVGPPPPRREVIVVRPAPHYVWVPGYYSWSGVEYVWVSGRWHEPPRGHRHWQPGRWRHHGRHGWYWQPGRWK